MDEGVASYVVEKDGQGCVTRETNTSYWRHQLQTLRESDDQCRPLRIFLYPADCAPVISKELIFYPNPTSGFIYLESSLAESGQANLIVLNSMGQQLNEVNIRFWAGIVEVDLSRLPNGI